MLARFGVNTQCVEDGRAAILERPRAFGEFRGVFLDIGKIGFPVFLGFINVFRLPKAAFRHVFSGFRQFDHRITLRKKFMDIV